MRLLRYEVSGFKNLVEPVVLEDLELMNVVHGDNNVGKSNVLESMLLMFWCLPRLANFNLGVEVNASISELKSLHARPESFFPLSGRHQAMQMRATIAISGAAFAAHPLPEVEDGIASVCVSVRLDDMQQGVVRLSVSECSYSSSERHDRSAAKSSDHVPTLGRILNVIAASRSSGLARVALVHTDRWLQRPFGPVPEREALGTPISTLLERTLFDARDTPIADLAASWLRFREVCAEFSDLLDGGAINVVNPSPEAGGRGRPFLIVDRPDGLRVPADQLGSGVQQLLCLVGWILTSRAAVVLVEEPELNLRHDHQVRLMRLLRDHVVGKPGAPQQLIMTSHSSAFEAGESFYAMERTPTAPKMTRHDGRDRARFLGSTAPTVLSSAGPATLSWLASDRVVQTPQFVVDHLQAQHGTAVIFHRAGESRVTMTRADAPAALDGDA